MLRELIDALEKADQARRLLSAVWAYVDPYTGVPHGGALPEHVRKELRGFFEFDDSE